MWSLRSLKNIDIIYYFPCDGQYVIGRKDCPVVINDDQSISRKHAILTIKSGEITLVDQASKFGTEVNKVKLTSNSSQTLHHNDVIKFGQGLSSFKLARQSLVFCCSNVSGEIKIKVQDYATKLGGKLVSNWSSSCTHLVMTGVTITVKVVNALSSCCPIVTPQWLEEAIECSHQLKPLPLTNKYIPEIVDANLLKGSTNMDGLTLKPLYDRRKLFAGKNIYFINESQCSNLKYSLAAAGGTVHLLTNASADIITHESSIVIDPVDNNKYHPLIDTVKTTLLNVGLKLVSETEIGYAVLYCSTQSYCNPGVPTSYSQLPPELPPPSLSSCPFPLTQAGTQSTDITILAYNTEQDQLPSSAAGVKRKEDEEMEGVEVVNETVVKEEASTSISTIEQSIENTPTAVNNTTILAPDSFPTSQYMARRKKESEDKVKEEDKEKENDILQSTKKPKINPPMELQALPPPITPTKFISTRTVSPHKSPHSAIKLKTSSPMITQHSTLAHNNINDTQENPLPGAMPITKATPISRATPISSSLFEGLKSQRSKRDTPKVTRSNRDTPLIVKTNKKKNEETQKNKEEMEVQQNNIIVTGVFISSRRKPSSPHQQLPLVEEQYSDGPCIPASVQLVNLVVTKKRRNDNDVTATTTNGRVKNFKKFKKVVHHRHTTGISRLIGGTDLRVYNQ